MTLWCIGFLFTVGYTGALDDKSKLAWWKRQVVWVGMFVMWPILLGEWIAKDGKILDDNKEAR